MRTSFRNLEKRLSRIERQVQPAAPCNCRMVTHFHNSDCLAAILDKTPRQCPVHGFREMGFFWWKPPSNPIVDEDNEICPCPPHPWRSFVLGPKPHTREGHEAARQAWENMPRETRYNLQQDNDRTNALVAAYHEAREQWILKTGRRLPSKRELFAQVWRRYGKQVPR